MRAFDTGKWHHSVTESTDPVPKVSAQPTGSSWAAQQALWSAARIVAEPGGAAALAALLDGGYTPAAGERVGVVISGGTRPPSTSAERCEAGRGSPMPLLGDLKTFVRYAGGLRAFLQDPLTSLDCRRIVEQQLRTREVSFLRMVERAVYANASSPYRALLQHRKIALEDVSRSLRQAGLEATLAWLYDEGIYVTLDQFNGRRPIERPGLGLPVRATDFDNPLLAHHYEASTGGSRGPGRAPSSISTCSPTRRRTTVCSRAPSAWTTGRARFGTRCRPRWRA